MKLIKKRKDGGRTVLRPLAQQHSAKTIQPWKVLVVDDEPDVHAMTELSLKGFEFAGKSLYILQAKSAQEAREVLSRESNIAVMLIDIVMETDDAGLNLINYIRNDLENKLVRIIVRTGQPGMNLERTVVEQYDIDDYKNKSELNVDKLYFTMRTTLKGYRDLLTLEEMNKCLEQKVQERTQQLELQNVALQELNRDKNEFLGIAAHDLKNPLQSIKGFAELITETLGDDKVDNAELIGFANMISFSADRMFDLVTNLLDVNMIETGQVKANFQQTDIYPVLQQVVDAYKKEAEFKKVKVHFESQSTQYMAYTDTNMLRQILDNIMSNAVKYSPFNRQIFIRAFIESQMIYTEIQDQGQGFSNDELDKLFGKFSRLSAKPTNGEHSTGLGLFIVKKLVNVLHGDIYCQSEQGQGAKFILTIPTHKF